MFLPFVTITVDSKIEQVSTDVIYQTDPIEFYLRDETQFAYEPELILYDFRNDNIVEYSKERLIKNQTARIRCSRIFESNFKFEE